MLTQPAPVFFHPIPACFYEMKPANGRQFYAVRFAVDGRPVIWIRTAVNMEAAVSEGRDAASKEYPHAKISNFMVDSQQAL